MDRLVTFPPSKPFKNAMQGMARTVNRSLCSQFPVRLTQRYVKTRSVRMIIKYFIIITSAFLFTPATALSDELSEDEIKKLFSNKTVEGKHLAKNFSFKRFYGADGHLFGFNDAKGERVGKWATDEDSLCHQWRRKSKCKVIVAEDGIIKMYNKRGTVVTVVFTKFTDGNNIDEAEVAEKEYYDGPMIDGHGHLGGDYDPDYMFERNMQDNIPKIVIFPRIFNSGSSSGTTEEEATKVAALYKNHIWMMVGLQRKDVFEMNWQDPQSWWQDWLKWARTEIESGRRRGIGELTAVHHAYHESEFAERDFPVDSKLVSDLLTLSAQTQRPLVLHAEGEAHVVPAVETQLKRHPKAILVWAHACGRSNPALVGKLLKTYPNLYCDLGNMTDTGRYGSLWPRKESWMSQWEKNGQILPAWVMLMEQFPDRFYLGMDTNSWRGWEGSGILSRAGRISRFRAVLSQLTDATIKSITVEVPTRLFGDR